MHYLDNDLELVGGLPTLFNAQTSEMQQLEAQIGELKKGIERSKTELLANFDRVTIEQREKHIESIRSSYKELHDCASKKYKLSSDLELLMDRVNHKVKSDVEAFTHELELENPGCTFELKKRFIEEYENASRKTQNRDARRRGDLHFEHKHAFGGVGRRSTAAASHLTSRGSAPKPRRGRPPASSLQLYVNTNTSRGVNGSSGQRGGDDSLTSPYWISPASEDAPIASTSRRTTPANVSPGGARVPHTSWNTSTSRSHAGAYSGYSTPVGGGEFFGGGGGGSDSLQSSPRLAVGSSAMPAFAGLHESQRGRPRKLTTRVKQMLTEQKTPRPPASVGYTPSSAHYYPQHQQQQQHHQHMSPLSTQSYSARGVSRRGKSARRRGRPRIHRASEDESRDAYTTDDWYTEQDSRDTADYADLDEVESPVEEAAAEDDQQWCFCRYKSYGNMCVGIDAMPPKGEKWFCPKCRESRPSQA